MNAFYLIVNPISGNGTAKKDWNKIEALLTKQGIQYDFGFTEKPCHEQELVQKAIGDGYRKFIVLGGDGTLNETINGIFHQTEVLTSDIALGAIPVGTGNDWCRMHHIPDNYEKAIEIIKAGKTFAHDVGVAEFPENGTKHFFIIMGGLGYDGFVAHHMNEGRTGTRGGLLAYYAAILKYLFKYQPVQADINIDGKPVQGKLLTACVAITQYNGGGMMQAPFAVANDGEFDITVIRDMSKPEMLLNIPRLMNGSFVKNRHVTLFKGKTVSVNTTPFSYVEADGESVGQTPVSFSILKKAVTMIVP
jgi:diacylglycerol kinase (ATP)